MDQEVVDRFGPGRRFPGLLLGLLRPYPGLGCFVALIERDIALFGSQRLLLLDQIVVDRQSDHCQGQQQDGKKRGCRHHGLVAPGQLDQSLPQRGPFGPDRFVFEVAAQVVRQLLGCGVAVGRVLLHRLQDDGFQFHRDPLVEPPRDTRILESDLPQQLLAVTALVSGLQCQ